MVHLSVIEARLSQLGFRASRWFKPEIRELQHILMDNEKIVGCVAGRYYGGFALLVATENRLLLIDKKIPYLSIEDIRYDMVSEIDYSARAFDATVTIFTMNKQHKFTTWKHKHHLRNMTTYAQRRVLEIRQYQQQGPQEVYQGPAPAPVRHSLFQEYNYGQTLQFVPPQLPVDERKRLPSPHLPRVVGAAAVAGASRRWINPNPYSGGALSMRGVVRPQTYQ
jgi:hypothetical protein